MMRWFCTALVLAVAMLAACSDPEPIRVGFVGTLSGRRSEVGVLARNAVQLHFDQINAAGGIRGRRLELVVRNNEGDEERNGRVIGELVDEGVEFIIGPFFSQMAESTLKAIEGRGVLLISPTMSTELLSGRDDNFLRHIGTPRQQADLLVAHALSLGQRRFVVVYDLSNQEYTSQLVEAFEELLVRGGGEVPLSLSFVDADPHGMEELARQIAEVRPEGVLLAMSAIDAAGLAQQLAKAGEDAALYGATWAQTADLLQHGGRAVEGMLLAGLELPGEPSEALQAFHEEFETRFGQRYSFAARLAYESVTMLAAGMRRADGISAGAVRRAILEQSTFQGLEREFTLDAYGDVVGGYNLVVVRQGEFVALDMP